MIAQLPEDVWPGITAHLHVHERLGLSRAFRALRFLAGPLEAADVEQAVAKHFVNGQVRYLHDEWVELRRMRAAGMAVAHAPSRLTTFMLGDVAAKRATRRGVLLQADTRFWHDTVETQTVWVPRMFVFLGGPAEEWSAEEWPVWPEEAM